MFESLKNKSNDTKKKIALLVAGIISGLIFVVWINFTYKETVTVAKDTADSGAEFWNELKEGMSSQMSDLGGKVEEVKDRVGAIRQYSASVGTLKEETSN